jgi:hypothetical protein
MRQADRRHLNDNKMATTELFKKILKPRNTELRGFIGTPEMIRTSDARFRKVPTL